MAAVSVIRVIFISVLISCVFAKFEEIRSQEEAFQYIAKKRYATPKIDLVEASPILYPLLDRIADELESENFFEQTDHNGTTSQPSTSGTTTEPSTNGMSTFEPITNETTPEPAATTLSPGTTTTKTPYNQCKSDLDTLGIDFLKYFSDKSKKYAAMMVDSYGKVPPGILQGNTQWIGLYDQCLRQTKEKTQQTFGAQYCIAHALNKTTNAQILAVGICVPDSCSEGALDILLYEGLLKLTLAKELTAYVSCNKEFEYNAGAISCLVLLSIIGVLIIAGTSYEFFTIYCVYQDDPLGFKTLTEEPDMINQEGSVQIRPSPTSNGVHMMSAEEGSQSYISFSRFVKKFLLCFSLITNGSKILKPTQGQSSLHALNGIRVLSLFWVILGHTYFFPLSLFSNPLQIVPILSRFSFQAVGNATFSVDSFFFLSGLLITYLTLNYLKKNNGSLNWGMFYLHRYLRLTPVYMLVIFIYTTLTPHFATGPMYSAVFDPNPVGYENGMTYCQKYWWTNMLYINNLYPTALGAECLGWSWYLANDMQFFIISPFIIYLLYHYAPVGISICISLLAMCFGSLIGLSIAKDIQATPFPLDPTRENFLGDDLYQKPYTRISTYLVGMAVGYILYRYHGRVRMPRYVAIIGWLIATGIGLSVVYGLYGTMHGHELSRGASVMYITFCRFAWAIALGWVSFACITGYGGPINTLLSWSFWIPLSRINYCAYLLHPIIMMVFQYSLPNLIYFSDFLLIYFFLGNLVLSYSAAFILSICVEAPFMALEKLILKRDKSV
ncbi:nose resistant to fluoxetine protein 6-like isoform X2 [Anneissia japonica]|uniref:nose resistant to fluoxetine protein 6-like isoform X2 n=1 Tax=Anneissia japonica TaxID=1529436 RepID=UPI0014258AA2|nr:nose resistant to fluoxetine protein 6-like isoform X2 [Anneissia japonica]